MHQHAAQIIAIETGRWKYAAAKDTHIREQMGISATRYYSILIRLLEDPEVEREWPMVVRRLRRVREARRRERGVDLSTQSGVQGGSGRIETGHS